MSNFSHSKTNWVMAGWNALHQAAMDAGAEISYEPWEFPELRNRSIADTACYVELLQPLTQLLNRELALPSMQAEPIRILVWRKLRELGRRTHPDLWRLLAEEKLIRNPAQEYQSVKKGLQAGKTTMASMSPILAARHGYRLLWREGNQSQGRFEYLLWGLALIGWSATHWKEVATCKLCFRLAHPGSSLCYEHTQSNTKGLERAAAYQRYRLGKRVHQLAEQRGKIEFLCGNAMLREARRHLALADVIFEWEYEADTVATELQNLQNALRISPRVLKKLGTEVLYLDFETLTENLRETLDIYHWDPMHWGLTILQAEMWMALEEELSPGVRRSGQATKERIKRARALADQGYRKTEIAKELGISPSSISKWIARGMY